MRVTGADFPRRPAVAPSLDRPVKPNALVRRGALGVFGAVAGLTLATLLPYPALAQELPNCNDLGQVLTPLAVCKEDIEGLDDLDLLDPLRKTVWGYQNDAPQACQLFEGPDNFFTPGAPFRDQPTVFEPGTVVPAFSIFYDAVRTPILTWFLQNQSAVSDDSLPDCDDRPLNCYAATGSATSVPAQVYDIIDEMYGREGREVSLVRPALACYSAEVVVGGEVIPPVPPEEDLAYTCYSISERGGERLPLPTTTVTDAVGTSTLSLSRLQLVCLTPDDQVIDPG